MQGFIMILISLISCKMLIDIEKYVRQLLPPNRRLPNHIGLATALYKPIDTVITSFNDFRYQSQFDTGTPGQVAVLEYILQNSVNEYIKILSADGVKVDFRVLVPEGLSLSERADVVRLIERYRLRSKRYEVTDLLDWGNGNDDPYTRLAWYQVPIVTPVNDVWNLQLGINVAGIYPLKITNTTTGLVHMEIDEFDFDSPMISNFTLFDPGRYLVTVASLKSYVDVIKIEETNIKPDWLLGVSYTYDPNAHECSKWVNTLNNVDIEILVSEAAGVPTSGLTWNNISWNNSTWIAGTTEWSNGYSEVFRVNGASFGNGGMLPNVSYRVKIRRTSDPQEVFVFLFKTPNSLISTPINIPFNTQVNSCEFGPFIAAGTLNATKTRIDFTFDARSVTAFRWRIKLQALVVANGTQSMLNGSGGSLFSPSNRPFVTFPELEPGNYTFEIEGAECTSVVSSQVFTISEDVIIDPNEPTILLGTYEQEVGGRTFTYQKSPGLTLQFNADGTISDVTPGTVHGSPSTSNGRTIFYMIGYSYLVGNGDGEHTYKALHNLYFPDGVYTIKRHDCNASIIPNLASFKAGISGYPQSTGVNKYNGSLSEVTLTIRTTANPGIPAWMKVSRALNFLPYIPSRTIGKKVFAIESINRHERPEDYHAKGVHTQTKFDLSLGVQPDTCRCYKWPWDLRPGMPMFTDGDLYNSLRGSINQYGLTPYSVITDEFPENAQGQDPNIGARVGIAYKGAMDLFRQKYPNISKRDTNLFGSYGGDNFYGLIDPQFISRFPRAIIAEYLNQKVHYAWDPRENGWYNHPCTYYASGQIDNRNVNVAYYMHTGSSMYYIPYELIMSNERIKIGSKTYQGQDRESDWFIFGTVLCQSLVMGDNGMPSGIEEAHTGDIIPFGAGEIWYYPSGNGVAGEHYELGFWGCLLGRGIMLWDGGNSYGTDSTKINYYTAGGWPIMWRPLAGTGEWSYYTPGENGAPQNTHDGLHTLLYSTVADASMLGHQDALSILGRSNTLYYASYSSTRKTFTASPGQTGYHLNGFGPLNIGLLAFKDALDQKCGVSLIGDGPSGKVGIYYNGFLSADEYEDNVILTYGGVSVNLGRVYGRQTKFKIF